MFMENNTNKSKPNCHRHNTLKNFALLLFLLNPKLSSFAPFHMPSAILPLIEYNLDHLTAYAIQSKEGYLLATADVEI